MYLYCFICFIFIILIFQFINLIIINQHINTLNQYLINLLIFKLILNLIYLI